MLYPGQHIQLLRSIIKSGECFSLKRLAIKGDDLLQLGFYGEELGYALKCLLGHVLENPGDNDLDTLLDVACIIKKEGSLPDD